MALEVSEITGYEVTLNGEVVVKTQTREEANHFCAGFAVGWEAAERHAEMVELEEAEQPEQPDPVEYEVFEDIQPLEAEEDQA